ncbi:hypothetical protein RchiOBHm_Chr1g0332101 [Rosa chinensis]|uniref:Uncharacterized protein n=1 Tax=Rosa chinensis TaxID=74649 RepID=A0A2P6SBQ9_ROSCH|nr:hypothetical protein RchiOBHm_Chr1g0332101 [Rosa chinensis]
MKSQQVSSSTAFKIAREEYHTDYDICLNWYCIHLLYLQITWMWILFYEVIEEL